MTALCGTSTTAPKATRAPRRIAPKAAQRAGAMVALTPCLPNMLVHPVSSSSQWELPLNPTVGHNLLKGAAPPDVRSVCDGIAVVRMFFAELSSMPWSSEGACLQCGRWVGAGNFAYSNVWLGIMSGDHCRHQVMLLSSSMETTIRKLERKRQHHRGHVRPQTPDNKLSIGQGIHRFLGLRHVPAPTMPAAPWRLASP